MPTKFRSEKTAVMIELLKPLPIGGTIFLPYDEPQSSLKHRMAMVRDTLDIDVICKWLPEDGKVFVARFK